VLAALEALLYLRQEAAAAFLLLALWWQVAVAVAVVQVLLAPQVVAELVLLQAEIFKVR